MKVKKQLFGTTSWGQRVNLFTLENKFISASFSEYGAAVTSLGIKNNLGEVSDVVLGFSTLQGYVDNWGSFGSMVGPYANRIGGGCFELDNKIYQLQKNEKGNTLHGGFPGFDKRNWSGKLICTLNGPAVQFTLKLKDGEHGFPGNRKITVRYSIQHNKLYCEYFCTTDKPTVISLTNHSYFNLADFGDVKNHLCKFECSKYLEVDQNLVPTGKLLDVKNTAFDFTNEKSVGKDLPLQNNGFDNFMVIDSFDNSTKLAATVREPKSGRVMKVYTNQPGFQFYTANYIGGVRGKFGIRYNQNDGLCIETSNYPDAPNKKQFPTSVLRPGEKYFSQTIFEFINQ